MKTFVIWSNEHRMWWLADRSGYTQYVEEAGRYSFTQASEIVASSTVDGRLGTIETDPVTGEEYTRQSEVLVMAPEAVKLNREVLAKLDGLFARLVALYHEHHLAIVEHEQQHHDYPPEIAKAAEALLQAAKELAATTTSVKG